MLKKNQFFQQFPVKGKMIGFNDSHQRNRSHSCEITPPHGSIAHMAWSSRHAVQQRLINFPVKCVRHSVHWGSDHQCTIAEIRTQATTMKIIFRICDQQTYQHVIKIRNYQIKPEHQIFHATYEASISHCLYGVILKESWATTNLG